ncbi:hypothetical protein [Hyphomonas sp.]|uniref:hypothetical protein n=1 Tax=Hyphomonas sp. TaxID=87 RepID=UPI003298973C
MLAVEVTKKMNTSTKISEFQSDRDFGVFPDDVDEILQAMPPNLNRGVGTSGNTATKKIANLKLNSVRVATAAQQRCRRQSLMLFRHSHPATASSGTATVS